MQSESYQVKLNYKAPDGYWVIGHIVEVMVPLENREEKRNYAEAEWIAKKSYPGCEIVSVTYV